MGFKCPIGKVDGSEPLFDEGWVCEVKQVPLRKCCQQTHMALRMSGASCPLSCMEKVILLAGISRLQSGGAYARGEARPRFRDSLRGKDASVSPEAFRRYTAIDGTVAIR